MSRDDQADVDGCTGPDAPWQLYVIEAVAANDQFVLGECIASTGETTLWLLRACVLDRDHQQHGRTDAAHEQLGPLPQIYRRRLRGVPARCGAARRNGQACRNVVARGADRCWHHDGMEVHHGSPPAVSLTSISPSRKGGA